MNQKKVSFFLKNNSITKEHNKNNKNNRLRSKMRTRPSSNQNATNLNSIYIRIRKERRRKSIKSSWKNNNLLPWVSIFYIVATIQLATSFLLSTPQSKIITTARNKNDIIRSNKIAKIPRYKTINDAKGILFFHSQNNIHLHHTISSPVSNNYYNHNNVKILQGSIHQRKGMSNIENGNYIRMIMAVHDDATDSEISTTKNNNRQDNEKEESNNDIGSVSSSSSSPPPPPSSSTSQPIISNIQIKSSSNTTKNRKRKKYKRKRPKSQSEKELQILKQNRQKQYEQLISNGKNGNLWDFESLFPAPKWDEETIHRDLYEVAERDASITNGKKMEKITSSSSSSSSSLLSKNKGRNTFGQSILKEKESPTKKNSFMKGSNSTSTTTMSSNNNNINVTNSNSTKVDRSLTRMVEDRLYGFRRGQMGEFEYDTSLMGDGAVKFRDGVRLGNALKVNTDRLTYFAKREMIHGKLEEAEELYEQAIQISPQDGRPYLGLARIAERRRDLKKARECLRAGISKSRYEGCNGANPFLLQALGSLEERMGHLSEAENLYIASAKSKPSHAAAWVSLAQLRTRKLRQGPSAGRVCYQTADKELKKAGLPPSSYVYTAWAGLECKAGNIRQARELFHKAFEVDPKCSAAWLQLGVMEANAENWDKAKECFETVLKFDNRNSRVLQAYALMESKRPDGNSREVIGLFEKALRANPRDGGVLQAYGLYVAKLGDIDSARNL